MSEEDSSETTTEVKTEDVEKEKVTSESDKKDVEEENSKGKEEKSSIHVTVQSAGIEYLVNGIMAYPYQSNLSGEYELKEMNDNGTLAKALYYSYGSLGYSKCYEVIDQVYVRYGAKSDTDKYEQSKDILRRLINGLRDDKSRGFIEAISSLSSYDSSVFTPYYLMNEEEEVEGYTSMSKQGYTTPHNTIHVGDKSDDADGIEGEHFIKLMTSGGVFNEGYPDMDKFTKVDGSKYGFPTMLDDIPTSWLKLKVAPDSEKHLYDATFTYTDLADHIDSRAEFKGATAKVTACSKNTSLKGKTLKLFHCLTGEQDSPPDAGCDSDDDSTTYDLNGDPIDVKLHFMVKYVDQKKHKVYIEYRTDYIDADSSRNYTSVQAVGGGIWYTYEDTKLGYVTINKDGVIKYANGATDANITGLKLTGTEYTVYESDKKTVVGVFAIADDGQGYVKNDNGSISKSKTMEAEVGEKYYVKETSVAPGYKMDSTGGDGKGFYEFTLTEKNTEATPLKISRVNEISPKSFTFRKVSGDTTCVASNPLYSLAGAEYVLKDNAGNFANFIVGYETKNPYATTGQNVKIPIFANTKTNHFVTDANGYLTFTFTYAGAESSISAYYNNYKKSGTTYTITFTGNIQAICGSYRLSEVKASKGYTLDDSCRLDLNKFHAFTLSEKTSTATVTCTEVPINDPISVVMQKEDAETGAINPIGSASLKGAIFEVDYYNNHYTKAALAGKTPIRKWYFETDDKGKWEFKNSSPLNNGSYKSDEFYIDKKTNSRTIPLGTVTIKEIVAPEGYLTTWDPAWKGSISVAGKEQADKELVLYQIKANASNTAASVFLDGTTEVGNQAQTITNIAYDYAKRGDIAFKKLRYDNGEPMKNIAFILESMTTHEKHIIVTDEEGNATTKLAKENVNENDKYLTDMSNAEQVNNNLKPTGIWFYGTADESKWDSNEIIQSRGALPYDTYTITEIPSKNNQGTQLVAYGDYIFKVSEEAVIAEDMVLDTRMPEIKSLSQDNETKSHFTYAKKGSSITDTISYEYLRFDQDYTLKGILVASRDGKTSNGTEYKAGQPLLDDNGEYITICKSFHTAAAGEVKHKTLAKGSEELQYTFDSESLMGIHAVWQTFLCNGTDTTPLVINEGNIDKKASGVISYIVDDVEMFVEEADLGNADEAVNFAGVSTYAWTSVAKTNTAQVSKNTIVKDTVYLSCLDEDEEYKLVTTLMDSETGEVIKANNGEPCETTTTIKYKEDATTQTMEVEVTLPEFDSTPYAEKNVVVFEKIYYKDALIASDEDLGNDDETVHFATMGTTATNETGDKQIQPKKIITIVDKVEYKNLVVGREYTITGTLHGKDEKGKVFTICKKDGTPITAKTTFTAKEPNGTEEVVFKFAMTDVKNGLPEQIVAFETMDYKGMEFLTHADIEDKGQTVEFPDIKIHTTAISEDTKDHIAGTYQTAKIIGYSQLYRINQGSFLSFGWNFDGQINRKRISC